MKNIKGCLLSNSDDWKTPKKLYDPLMELQFIDCFQYKANYNEFDNVYINKKLFVNPPFSKLKEVEIWLEKQIKNHNKIILLIPSRTDTQYFHKLLKYCPVIYFIEGRLHYNESKSAPFPSIIMIFDENVIPIYLYGTIERFIEIAKKEIWQIR